MSLLGKSYYLEYNKSLVSMTKQFEMEAYDKREMNWHFWPAEEKTGLQGYRKLDRENTW